MDQLIVDVVPARTDNYIFLIFDPTTETSGVIDPADAEPVEAALSKAGRQLNWIINTHHHDDHIGGNSQLKDRFNASIAAPLADNHRIPDVDVWLADGDQFKFGSKNANILATPGHTQGHISLWFANQNLLFCGDTLFALGCGRLFEGTPQQMWSSISKFSKMPDETTVFCGHEYTASNAKFALTIEPENVELQQRATQIDEARRRGLPTIPTNLGIERRTNPFLRPASPAIRAKLDMQDASDAEVFAEIRRLKDLF